MELKKNPNVDPSRNTTLFTLLGLVSVLAISYVGIELKSYEEKKKEDELFVTDNNVVDDEETIITLPPVQKLPPPPPPAPEVIEVVKDEIKLEEKKIETTEVEENKPVVVVKASEVGDGGDDFDIPDEMPFTVIEQVPMFPGCEKVAKAKQTECFQEKLDALVKKNFNMPDDLEPGYSARVFVNFLIDKDGSITEIKTRGTKGSEEIEKEALKAFNKLPKIIPGKQRGKPVKVRYTYPITVKIQ